MCDCIPSTLTPYSGIRISKLGFTRCIWRPRNGSNLFDACNFDGTSVRNGSKARTFKSMNGAKVSRNFGVIGSEYYDFYGELGFNEKGGNKRLGFGESQNDTELENLTSENGVDFSTGIKEDGESSEAMNSSSSTDFPELKGSRIKSKGNDEDLVKINSSDREEFMKLNGGSGLRGGRQVMRRSNMLAKQVISIQSALSLGFVSQLWVDTSSWLVMLVEVRPNLLSGELEKFLLEDVSQVGDVVLVQDESVIESEFRMVGLETLVGYNVVTPGQRNIGKVRGYTFDINSGAVESLEFDSFGISLIPSSLVSTYALFVEDVLEVVSDTVVVHEAAASHIQRLTKGFWGSQNVGTSINELGEYSDLERQPVRSDHDRSMRRSSSSRKFRPKMRETEDDWELPMDYL